MRKCVYRKRLDLVVQILRLVPANSARSDSPKSTRSGSCDGAKFKISARKQSVRKSASFERDRAEGPLGEQGAAGIGRCFESIELKATYLVGMIIFPAFRGVDGGGTDRKMTRKDFSKCQSQPFRMRLSGKGIWSPSNANEALRAYLEATRAVPPNIDAVNENIETAMRSVNELSVLEGSDKGAAFDLVRRNLVRIFEPVKRAYESETQDPILGRDPPSAKEYNKLKSLLDGIDQEGRPH